MFAVGGTLIVKCAFPPSLTRAKTEELLRHAPRFCPLAGIHQGSFTIALSKVDNVTVMIKLKPRVSPGCQIRVKYAIRSELKIKPGENVTFTFTCNTPEKYFIMEIRKNIDCVSGLCPFGDVHLYPMGLPRLNRTFVWDVKASTKAGLELKFSTPWLRQIEPGETCPDSVRYNINSCVDTATVNIGTFCRNGSVSRIKLLGGVIMSLHLSWDSPLTTSGFNIANRASIKRLCIIESVLNGESSVTLMSPNYPLAFPEDELMTWQFVIPSNLRASVFFHNYSLSNCERKEERVEYYIPGSLSNPEVFKLSDSQPANIAGSFNLSLQGCDQDAQNPGVLRLLFQVIVQHPQVNENVTHVVDLSKERNMTVTIHFEGWPNRLPLTSEPMCLICKDPRTCDRVLTLMSGTTYKISFLCKDLSRLRITAEKGISCVDLRWCQRKIYSLVVPKAITQLPIRLHKFIWKILAPDLINVEITSPSLKLQQHVPEQRCNTSYSYGIVSATPETELNVGVFCPGGSIEKIQMRNNITVSLKTFGKGFLNESDHQDLKMSFVPHIKDECIFTVSPDPKAKVYLQTPNWPYGLPPYVSVSWYVVIPSKQVARLGFSKDRMGISCETGRAYVNIKEEAPGAEETVRREDELLPQPRDMYHDFWVNVSNCKPVEGTQLTLQFWVTLADKSIDLGMIVAVVAGAGVLVAIVLTVCCVKKKKKKIQSPAVGVYNMNVNTQVPRKQGLFTKGRKTNESHVYAVIDDAMVYGHLLKESNGSVTPEVDVYRPFDGPVGSLPPSPPPFFRKDIKRSSNTEEPPSLTDTDHDTYTFAHQKLGLSEDNGDTNEKNDGDTSVSLLENKEQDDSVMLKEA
ncbi:PREDICTED: CUB domain-containing protein 1 [Apaloderma vittatum]|uniref:CUB domain-containing protein 1 n=1 Tax=Apaloderma vittatum TaxID=57397 RepID=UPI000521239B|nr:PREDICTED: CUB domain-containing protein 1 [Apaloderma vittatum]